MTKNGLDLVILDDLDRIKCTFPEISKTMMIIYLICLLGAVFIYGWAAGSIQIYFKLDELKLIPEHDPPKCRTNMTCESYIIGGSIGISIFASFFLIFGIYGLRMYRDIQNSDTETKEFKVTHVIYRRCYTDVDGDASYEDMVIHDDKYHKYEICEELKGLLKENDIILADIKKHKVVKIYYIIRGSRMLRAKSFVIE